MFPMPFLPPEKNIFATINDDSLSDQLNILPIKPKQCNRFSGIWLKVELPHMFINFRDFSFLLVILNYICN